MELNEIKKALYKKNPKASFSFISKGVAHYNTWCPLENDPLGVGINFSVPVSDMGDGIFFREMDAKLLNRWIVNTSNKTTSE